MPYLPAELANNSSRDLTEKVKQVQEILPQVTDDQACLALAGADDDVMRAVESLLASAEPEPPPPRPVYETWAPEPEPVFETVSRQPPAPEAPVKKEATPSEKELMKWRKKLREIEKIELAISKGEKVQPNQLPKLEKRDEVELNVIRYESICAEEKIGQRRAAQLAAQQAREAEAARLQEAAEQRRLAEQQRREEERLALEAAARAREEAQREHQRQEQQRQAQARRPPQQAPRGHQSNAGARNAGADILGMVKPAAAPQKTNWGDVGNWDDDGPLDVAPTRTVLPPAKNGQVRKVDMTEYTTPLDEAAIPEHVREQAARIAAEIEAGQTAGKASKKGGKGKKGRDRDDWGAGDEGWKGKGQPRSDAKGKGKRRDDGAAPRGDKGGYGGAAAHSANPDDGGFDEWLRQRRGGGAVR